MTMRFLLTIIVVSGAAGTASAQVVAPPNAYLPNYYNRQTQPLSPYLNLLRGSNPGVDYYYGVRPGLPSGGQPFAGAAGRGYSPFQTLSPQFSTGPGQLEPGEGYVLPPAGHVNTYGNYFGTAGSSLPGYGGARGGATPGIANTRPRGPAVKPGGNK